MNGVSEAHWQRGKLGNLLPLKYGKGLPENSRDASGSAPVFGSSGQVGRHSQPLTSGPTLIVGRKGTVGAVHLSPQPCWPIDTVYFAEAEEGQNLKYYKYLLDSLNLARLDRSTAIPGLSRDDYNAIEVTIAPPREQRRIVAEIETQFSRLDEAVVNLKRVKTNLRRYKDAVLKAAVEGRLLPIEADIAGREDRSYETGSQLLVRVLQERRRAWSGKGTYQDSERPETRGLPLLPDGWVWARLDAVAALKGGITVDSKRHDPRSRLVPYLRVANVQRGFLDLDEVKEIEATQADIDELRLQPGDILFNEGGDRDKLGRGWIWGGQLAECIHQNHVFRARPYTGDVSGKLLSWWGNTFGKDYFLREGKQTTNLASINMTKLSAFPVPIPPVAEQHRIVAEVDRRLSIVREVEVEVDANLKRAQGLRQAVLAKAFRVS